MRKNLQRKRYTSLLALALCASLLSAQATWGEIPTAPPVPLETAGGGSAAGGSGAGGQTAGDLASGSAAFQGLISMEGPSAGASGNSAGPGAGSGQSGNAGPGAGESQDTPGAQTGAAGTQTDAAGTQTGNLAPGETSPEAQAPQTGSDQTGSAGPGAGVSQGTAGTQTGGAGTGASVSTLQAPQIQSEGAALIDGSTGKLLYGKNENTQFYPASITKLMTALLVAENCSLDEVVTFSETATTNLESGAVTLNLTAGDQLTVEDCLYALLLKSANEVANGLAEHVDGSVEKFADRMNAKAKELGCLNTNFENPNGLNNAEHKTTPYDMALIARAAFENPVVQKIDSTLSYKIAPTSKNPSGRTVTMGHKMFYSTDSRYYPGIIGGKTGYTSKAGNTLVTGAEKNGVRLIAVVMKSASTHYADTKALLDYGFENYSALMGGASGASAGNRWEQDGDAWHFIKGDGTRAAGEWLTIDGQEYWFDADGVMATGWRQAADGQWYYFRSSGAMARDYWAQSGENWYYLGSDGLMVRSAYTPDGYYVDENGAWVQPES